MINFEISDLIDFYIELDVFSRETLSVLMLNLLERGK